MPRIPVALELFARRSPRFPQGRSSNRLSSGAVTVLLRYLALGANRRRVMCAVVGGATLLALAAPAAASAGHVPEQGHLSARLVTASPAAKSTGVHTLSLRTLNPARYAREKAAANTAYQAWAARHPQVFGPGLTIGAATIAAVSKPGMAAAASGGATPPDTTGAIGPNAYVEFVNSRVGVFNRVTLGSVAQVPEDTFVAGTDTCDGQIKWDNVAKRWLYYSLDCNAPTASQGFSFGFS
jgi:hypothetical protein